MNQMILSIHYLRRITIHLANNPQETLYIVDVGIRNSAILFEFDSSLCLLLRIKLSCIFQILGITQKFMEMI